MPGAGLKRPVPAAQQPPDQPAAPRARPGQLIGRRVPPVTAARAEAPAPSSSSTSVRCWPPWQASRRGGPGPRFRCLAPGSEIASEKPQPSARRKS